MQELNNQIIHIRLLLPLLFNHLILWLIFRYKIKFWQKIEAALMKIKNFF
jgi:hypothetical protein